jgi:lipoate-protein ligase A
MSGWRVLFGGASGAARQMALDEALARAGAPAARLFTWNPPAASLGWKQPRPAWLDPERFRAAGLELVERPTGGGLAVHGTDCSIAVVVPREAGLPLSAVMSMVCRSAVRICRTYGVEAQPVLDAPAAGRVTYCLAEPSPYAVMVGARKVAGFGLRRYPHSWLIQGSLLVRAIPYPLAELMSADGRGQFAAQAIHLAEAAGRPVREEDVASRWAAAWPGWWDELLTQELAHAV